MNENVTIAANTRMLRAEWCCAVHLPGRVAAGVPGAAAGGRGAGRVGCGLHASRTRPQASAGSQ